MKPKKKLPIIKFSHEYTKLLNESGELINMAKLLNIIIVHNPATLSNEFINYDTDDNLYKIDFEKKLMILFFLKPKVHKSANLFTTIRTYTPEKYKYYKKLIGQVFTLEYIKDEKTTNKTT